MIAHGVEGPHCSARAHRAPRAGADIFGRLEFHAAKLVSKIVVSTDPGRVEDPVNLLLRERFFFLFLDLS